MSHLFGVRRDNALSRKELIWRKEMKRLGVGEKETGKADSK